MKVFKSLLLIMVIVFSSILCSQQRSDYEITWNSVNGASKYGVFLEERNTSSGFNLVEDMDYLSPNVSAYKLAEITDTIFVVNLLNDGKYVVAGVVAISPSGYYSPMSVSQITRKGQAPAKPAGVIFRKK